MTEIWKEHQLGIKVSNFGRIETRNKGKWFGSDNRWGYKQVWWKGKTHRVNRLVYETFVGEIPDCYDINHIDENKSNNRVDNLNLMTHKQNCNWGTRNKRVAEKLTNRKDLSKVVLQFTKDGRSVREWSSTAECGRNGFNHQHISKCCIGKRKSADGYIWRYK